MSYSAAGSKGGGHKDCAYGREGKTFVSSPPTVVARKHGHLERPPSQELAVGVPGKMSCDMPVKKMGCDMPMHKAGGGMPMKKKY